MIEMPALSLTELHQTQAIPPGRYGGAEVPLFYSSIEEEYDAACSRTVLINRSWMGKLHLRGADSLELLHRLSTNDLLHTETGDLRPTVLLTEKGRIIDYLYVLVEASSCLLLVSPTSEDRLQRWIEKYTIMEDVHVERVTSSFSLVSLIGPLARQSAEEIFQCSLPTNKVMEVSLPFANARVVFRHEFNTDCVDMLIAPEHSSSLWNRIAGYCNARGLLSMGAAAYEAYRISRGMPVVGAELSENFNPYEVGLRDAISFTKGCYIGQEVIARLDTYGKVQREPWGLVFDAAEPLPVSGATIMREHEELGVLTSVSPWVVRGKRCGIGILKKKHARSDDPVGVTVAGGLAHAVCKPFPVLL